MKRVSYKKILFFVILIVLIIGISSVSFAGLVTVTPNVTPSKDIVKVSNILIGAIQIVAVAIAIVMLVVLAIKYITAAPGEKAEVKKGMTIYIIGALILFAGSGILGLIQSFANDVNKNVITETKPGTSWFKTIFGL